MNKAIISCVKITPELSSRLMFLCTEVTVPTMFKHILDLLCMRMLMFGDCRHSLRAVLKFSGLHYAIRI